MLRIGMSVVGLCVLTGARAAAQDPSELFAYYNGYRVNANNAPFASESWRATGSKWTEVRHLALGDVTGDGYADVVGVAGNGELFAYYNGYKVNANNAPFVNEGWRATGSKWADVRHLALGDVTGDGYADVVGVAGNGELFAYYNGYKVNANNAPFANESWRATGSKWTDVRHLALGDVTGDGYADVVGVAGNGELFAYYNGYKVNANNAPFANESWRATGSKWTDVRHLALGDVTGDGYADVIGVAGNGELIAYYNGYKVNANNAPFANESWRAKGSKWTEVRHPALGDVTGDGYADLVGASG